MQDNDSVIGHCEAFLRSMGAITPPSSFGCQIHARVPATGALRSLAERCAHADVATAPVTLTVGTGTAASFDVRGTHALGTLVAKTGVHRNSGALVLVALTIVFAMLAILLLRAR